MRILPSTMKRNESVWDYPRPPRLDPSSERVEVIWKGQRIVHTTRSIRILETSHPPAYYFHPEDVDESLLSKASGATNCEWKGRAQYFDLSDGPNLTPRAFWCYPEPSRGFREIAGWYSLYPALMDTCLVDGEPVTPQEGSFYGGWITPGIAGPFKGGPGTTGW